MHINYIQDRRSLGYKAEADNFCAHKMLLIEQEIIMVGILIIISVNDRKLVYSNPVIHNKNINIIQPSSSKEFAYTVRGGEDRLAQNIVDKVSYNHSIPSPNKVLKKLADVTLQVITDPIISQLLIESRKPIQSPLFVDGFQQNTLFPRKKNKDTSRITKSWLDTACYARNKGKGKISQKNRIVAEITPHSGQPAILTDSRVSHLVNNHANELDINNPLPIDNLSQKPTNYSQRQIKTKANNATKTEFIDKLTVILEDSKNTKFYEDTTIRKIRSDIFHTRKYGDPKGGFIIGVHREGHLKDMITKAQSMSGDQLDKFIKTNFSSIGD